MAGTGLGRLQQLPAVGSDQTGDGDDALLGLRRRDCHAFKKERHPRLPITLGADDRQTAVMLCLVLLQVAAEVHQRLGQQVPVFQQRGNQQAPDAPVAIQKWMGGLELRVDECDLGQRRKIIRRFVDKPLQIGQQFRHTFRWWRNEHCIAEPRATDPVLRTPQFAGLLARAAHTIEQQPVRVA